MPAIVVMTPVDEDTFRITPFSRSAMKILFAFVGSTAMPVGAVRLMSLGVLEQLFPPKPPPQVPNTRCAVWLVSGESYSNTASGKATDM